MAKSASVTSILQREARQLEAKLTGIRGAIAALRGGSAASPFRGRPGRPPGARRKRSSMSAAARKAVSARMKKYWAARRAAKAGSKK